MQQINLYQSQFRNKSEPVVMQHLLLATGGIIILMLLLSVYRQWNISSLESELQQRQQQLATLKSNLDPLKRAQATIQKSPVIQTELKEQQNKVNTKQQLLKIMSQQSFGNTNGFTEQLTGLAQQRIEGLWLTSLTIRSGGIYMDLQGNSLRAELLPQYIQRLSNESIFSGTEFDSLVMERHEKNAGWITFALNSRDKVNLREP